MRKIFTLLLCLVFTSGAAYAQEAFLSLTKYSEPVEKLPTNITIITLENIEDKHIETLGELLQNETSINYKAYGTVGSASSVSIRGASSLQTLVLIDGRRVNDIGLGSADFTSIPISNIERIEIIRGAGSSIYGTSAFGGVINVITKKASAFTPVIDTNLSYGSFNTLQAGLTGAYQNERIGALIASSMLSSDGERSNSAFNSSNVLFNGSAKITDSSEILLSANIYDSVAGVPGSLTYPSAKAEQQDSNTYIKADYNALFGESILKVSAYTSQNKRKYSDSSAMFGDTKDRYTGETIGAQADFIFNKYILAGAEWWQELYRREDLLSSVTLTDRSRTDTAAYMQMQLELWKFNIIPSLRGDSNSAFGEVLTPALSVVFNADEKFKVSANCGKVWRAPTFSELYDDYAPWSYGNPDLKPEHGISYDLGAEYSYGKLRFAATGFYIDSNDLIKYTGTTYENISKARQYGAEIEAGQIVTSWLSHKVNYTFLKAEDEDTDKTLTYSPANTINYTLTVKPVGNLSVSGVLAYKDSQKTGSAAQPELDGFITVDVNAKYKVNEYLNCWIKVPNITNTNYQMVYDYPMPGTAVYAGIDMKFWK